MIKHLVSVFAAVGIATYEQAYLFNKQPYAPNPNQSATDNVNE
jgi:hypothetical protein